MGKLFPQTPVLGGMLAVLAAASPACMAGGEKPPAAAEGKPVTRAEFQQRIRELDSSYYDTRRLAAERLERWLAMPEMAGMLAEQFQQLIVQPELPFEVRWRISVWRGRLPPVKSDPPQAVSAEELRRLVRQLDDDSYAVRVGAAERLRWMAASPALAKPIMLLLKSRLTDPLLSEDTYRRAESIRDIAWGMWISSDASDWDLPPVSNAQIDQWLDELAQPAGKHDPRAATGRRIARQELMDVLSQDRDVPRVKAAIEARLRGKLDERATAELKGLLNLTRPALVLEIWTGGKQTLQQHLVVGQPTPTAGKPIQFDRADDRTAHCKSGNSLLPGDYPVGVAFAANRWTRPEEAVFHLVNLPTPRRQIAYSYYVKTDEAARLAKLSHRTLERFLSKEKLLDDAELGMLGQLEAGEVSRFASRYFRVMKEDAKVAEDFDVEISTSRKRIGNQSSCLGSICAQLACNGTHEAVPGLLEAIRQKKFMSPTPLAPYKLQWLAAFSIACRDPWPDVDAWLAENVENQETIIDQPDAEEVGATAAGILLTRHAERPETFGLQRTPDPHLADLKLTGFRYGAADGAQRVQQWWKRRGAGQKRP
jgi:hypothetical protein